jgi:hypothetical protein
VVLGQGGCFAGAMTDIRTSRLQLHAIDVPEGERIFARSAGPADAWSDDFPFEGDVGAVEAFLRATAGRGELRPFGYYRITRQTDGRVVGGIGFKGQPEKAASRSATGWLRRPAVTASPPRRSSPCWGWPPTRDCPV